MIRLAALLTCLTAGAALAQYERTQVEDAGHPLCVTWAKRTFVYQIDRSGSARTPGEAEVRAVDAAFRSWQSVSDTCSDFTFTRGPDSVARRTGLKTAPENTVIWRERSCDQVPDDDPCWKKENDDCSSVYDCWPYGFGVVAMTHAIHSRRTGIITDADIELNGADWLFTTVDAPLCDVVESTDCIAMDVQATMTHEIGHAVGFDDLYDAGSRHSTMYGRVVPEDPLGKRVIDADTREGFCTVYPRGEPPLPCDELDQAKRRVVARGGGSPSSSQLGCASALGAPLALAVLLLARRRRQRVPSPP